MALEKITALVIGESSKFIDGNIKATTNYYPEWFQREIGLVIRYGNGDVARQIKNNFYNVYITVGDYNKIIEEYPYLYNGPYYIRRKWLHFENLPEDSDVLGQAIVTCYTSHMFDNEKHVCSVITPLYHTKENDFLRAYESLKSQTNNNWEWILIDDSKDKSTTSYIKEYTKNDFRVKYYPFENSGVIGEVKRKGFMLATGDYLVELDHDDELLPDCLDLLVKAYKSNPDIGFVYSDCYQPHIDKNGNITGSTNYGDNWGFGYGTQVMEEYNKMKLWRVITPNQNPMTVRFITAMPNHVRSWRKEVYYKIGGHNPNLPISDDYELCVKTFLATRMAKIPKALYMQYHYYGEDVPNTHWARNAEIQRTTWLVSRNYDKAIHERFIELGVDDYLWSEEKGFSEGLFQGAERREEHTTIILDLEKL